MLEEEGYQVVWASTGRAAVEAIDELLGTMAKVLAKPGIKLSAPAQVIGRA